MSVMYLKVATEFVMTKVKTPQTTKDRIAATLCVGCGESVASEKRTKCYCHVACYGPVYARISAGDMTKKEAIEKGLIGPDQPRGRKPRNPMAKRLAEL